TRASVSAGRESGVVLPENAVDLVAEQRSHTESRGVGSLHSNTLENELENLLGRRHRPERKIKIDMSESTESKRLLSHVIAEWACALNYEDLSPKAIQAAKLFWFDSIGCALGGSQQEDAKILLKHYRAISATADSSRRTAGEGGGKGKATAFVSGFKTNPVDAAFLNGHMIRAMDYNDIYWKADPCHPSDLIAAPLALCESEDLSGKDLILATIIAYEIEMRLCEI